MKDQVLALKCDIIGKDYNIKLNHLHINRINQL